MEGSPPKYAILEVRTRVQSSDIPLESRDFEFPTTLKQAALLGRDSLPEDGSIPIEPCFSYSSPPDMPRLLQSALYQVSSEDWLQGLREESTVVQLSPVHPTLLIRLVQTAQPEMSRFDLVFGLFRTSWNCAIEIDIARGRLVSKASSAHFSQFEQTLCWHETDQGLAIQSDLQWSGARSGLEDLLLKSLLRFPGVSSTVASERPTRRLTTEGQAAA